MHPPPALNHHHPWRASESPCCSFNARLRSIFFFSPACSFCSKKFHWSCYSFALRSQWFKTVLECLLKQDPAALPPQWFRACACLCMCVCVCARLNADMFVFIESDSRTVACTHSSARVAGVQTRRDGGEGGGGGCLKYTQA